LLRTGWNFVELAPGERGSTLLDPNGGLTENSRENRLIMMQTDLHKLSEQLPDGLLSKPVDGTVFKDGQV